MMFLRFYRCGWRTQVGRLFSMTLMSAFVLMPALGLSGCKHVDTAEDVSHKAELSEATKARKNDEDTPKHEKVPGDSLFMSSEAQEISSHLDR